MSRRFPAPWTVVATPAGWRVEDANGMAVAFTYGDDDPGKRRLDDLTVDEARRIAVNIARLPDLLAAKER
jgi:hypothetical protein